MKNGSLKSLKKKVLQGILVLIIREFGLKFLAIVGQLLLVKLIAPLYFGFFAILAFVVGFFELFSDLGLTQAIIQRDKKISNIQLSTIFYLKFILSILSITLLALAFPLVRHFLTQLTNVHYVMLLVFSTTLIIRSFKGILVSLFDKELNYRVISKIDLTGTIVYFIVAIFLALNKAYLWNFIYAIVAKECIEFAIAFYYKPWLPLLKFDIGVISEMIRYGAFLQIGNFIALLENSIIPIAGFRLPAFKIGLLNWSFSIANISNTLFENYGRVAFAGMAKIQSKKDKISQAVNKSISVLNTFAFLFILLIFGYSKEFINLFLSKDWIAALPSLYWFTLGVFFIGGSVTIANAIFAIGKSKGLTFFAGVNVLGELLLAFFLGRSVGFVGIAVASFVATATQFVGYVFLSKKAGLHVEIKKSFFDKTVVLFVSAIAMLMLKYLYPQTFFIAIMLKIVLTIGVYIFFLTLFSKHDVLEIINLRNIIKDRKKI